MEVHQPFHKTFWWQESNEDLDTARVPAEAGADQDETEDESDDEGNGVAGVEGSHSLGLEGNSEQGKTEGLGGKRLSHAIVKKKEEEGKRERNE